MKRVLSVEQSVNFDARSLRKKSLGQLIGQSTTKLAKLIGISAVMLGVFTPVHSATAFQIKSSSGTIDVGKNVSSFLSGVIAGGNLNSGNSTSTSPIPEMVVANQPISEDFAESLISKTSESKNESTDRSGLTDPSKEKLEFEPTPDPAIASEIIKPIQLELDGNSKSLNVLTSIKPLTLLAMELTQANSSSPTVNPTLLDNQKFDKISNQLIENLESGIVAIASTSGLVPELPSLIAKVYLPETSDYGLASNFVWPAQGMLSSRFGWRWGRLHQGVDIAAPVGTPIWASANGTVDYAGWNSGGYGNMIDIIHSNGTITRYAHLNAIYVKRGQVVGQSQVIAAMGNSGRSTGPHLHFEIRPNGRTAIDPMSFLAQIVSRG